MKYASAVAVFAAGILLQWWWSTYLSVSGLAPQILLILTVAVSSQSGPVVGQCYAFAWGLFLDLLGAHLFGANALIMTLMAYLTGNARRQMDVTSPISQAMVAGLVTVAYFLLLALAGLTFKGQTFWVGWKAFLLDPVYNVLLAPVGFAVAQRFVRLP